MSQSVTTVQQASPPVDLELDQEYNHYDDYGIDDHFDHLSATSPAAHEHSDTLGASHPDHASATDLGSPASASPASVDLSSPSIDQGYHGTDYAHDHDHEYKQSQQPLVSPSQSHLPPASSHGPHQGHGQQQQPSSVSQPYESVRSTRSHSVAASLASIGSQSSIRRKPLSPTASPLAVRFSSRFNQIGQHSPLHDLHYPQPPDSGFYSLDSPDLYDLSPNKSEHAPVSTTVPGNTISLPAPLVEESDEDE